MLGPTTVLLGVLLGIGLFAFVVGFTRKPAKARQSPQRLKKFKAKGPRSARAVKRADSTMQIALSLGLGAGAWLLTGWYAAALIGVVAGWAGPQIAQAPKRRRKATEEIEAYSQWTEQIRDLVGASGSLFEAVTLSADNAPAPLRPAVMNMAALARAQGLPAAMDWFAAEMRSPYADRLVLGLRIAWDSGARVTEAFESAARAMRAEVEMRQRNEVANSRAWTQVTSILLVTFVVVGLLAIVNRGFFEPFGTVTGQAVLMGVGGLMAGSIFWVLKLSETNTPIRLLEIDVVAGQGKAEGGRGKAGVAKGAAPGEAKSGAGAEAASQAVGWSS